MSMFMFEYKVQKVCTLDLSTMEHNVQKVYVGL